MHVLVTGATGYVGSRVVPRLLADGHAVTVLTRDRTRATARPWADDVTIAEGDVTDGTTVTSALMGVDTALYLVHGMAGPVDFVAAEEKAARTFADNASLAGVEHVVYLGGLADETDAGLSRHLASRLATGRRLADGGPPTTELRASIVLGTGSSSFELIRFAAHAAPLLARPTWARRRCQPVAVDDLLDAIGEAVAAGPRAQHRIVEVAGPEALEYVELVHRMREVEGHLRLPTVDVPGVPPAVAGLAATVVTPVPAGLVAPLVESLAHDTVVDDRHEQRIGRLGIDGAMRRALEGTGAAGPMAGDPDWVGVPADLPAALAWWATRLPAGILQGPQLAAMAASLARAALAERR
jgi:uncharacterized protein YbjT (DUF2867 family)